MKTNQVMTRQMGEFKVEQRTKDGFFNITSLIKQWNAYVEIANRLNTQDSGDLVGSLGQLKTALTNMYLQKYPNVLPI